MRCELCVQQVLGHVKPNMALNEDFEVKHSTHKFNTHRQVIRHQLKEHILNPIYKRMCLETIKELNKTNKHGSKDHTLSATR